jgi:hypothetical protein
MTEERREYHILPNDPVAALNILREAAGLGPWREGGEEVKRNKRREQGEKR